MVKTMNARGAYTALVSGGFTYFTEKVAADAGFAVGHPWQHGERPLLCSDRVPTVLQGQGKSPALFRENHLPCSEKITCPLQGPDSLKNEKST